MVIKGRFTQGQAMKLNKLGLSYIIVDISILDTRIETVETFISKKSNFYLDDV